MTNFKYMTSKTIMSGFVLYWMVFWLFNGLDKFLNRSSVGAITWFGKDRSWQFGVYLENLGLPLDYVPGILTFAGFWELAIAIIFLSALNVMLIVGKREQEAADRLFMIGLFFSTLTFVAFCAFDTVVGDRAELLEHSTYIAVIAVSFIGMAVEKMNARQKEQDHTFPPHDRQQNGNASFTQSENAKILTNPAHTPAE